MHFVISNVPENFHSADLRNFFSEFIEKRAFNCFHFRHRPQSNLLDILNKSLILSDVKVSQGEVTGDKGESDRRETTNRTARQTDSSSGHRESGDRDATGRDIGSGHREGSDKTATGRESSSNNGCNSSGLSEKTEVSERENVSLDSSTKAEVEGEASEGSKTHWLNSGLAGLASLINEKKKQVRSSKKWPYDLEEVAGKISSGVKEAGNVSEGDSSSEARNSSRKQPSSSLVEVLSPLQEEASKRTCCVVDVKDSLQETFIRKYDRKHWLTRSGDILPQRCYLLKVDFRDSSQSSGSEEYKTREEFSALSLVSGSVQDLLEFRPPPIMPQGNVGTPTHHFRELIRTCQMPGTLIKKLGLEFPRGRGKKRFGQVPFDYGTSVVAGQEDSEGQKEADIAFTATGHLIPSSADFEEQQRRRKREKKRMSSKGPRLELEKEEEDGAEVEEWERYESFHEDVTSQDRIKERRFEEELEVVWEKGGSGLVFYTDAQFWRAQQGDFDEQTADEWDVDMSVYYEEGAGDRDARDSAEMVQSDKLKSGSLAPSVFVRRKGEEEATSKAKRGRGRRKIGPTLPPTIGRFEAHTRGFGRRMMEAQGWKEGQGLGVGSAGMPYALEGDGQHPHDRKGFGYHGEKLQGWASSSSTSSSTTTQRPQHRHHRISTIFDRAEDADPPAPTLRTPEPTALSHRPR
ncbi:G patch domain-containing protein 3-like [Scylla paramamosain]|uniref:G patch domain-containing protein 3-like n=1 Tax=Scylla paramamosain TaxID=85552 RepID=UPI003083A7CB